MSHIFPLNRENQALGAIFYMYHVIKAFKIKMADHNGLPWGTIINQEHIRILLSMYSIDSMVSAGISTISSLYFICMTTFPNRSSI